MHLPILSSLALFPALLVAGAVPDGCGNGLQVRVRYPPVIQADPNWVAPPYAWNFGRWHATYTSFAPYLSLWNLEADLYPQFPTTAKTAEAGSILDVTSYNLPPTGNASVDSLILKAFGLDTPALEFGPAIWNFTGQGVWNLTNYYMLLAWGYDTNGDGYFVQYETPPTINGFPTPDGDIAVVSRSPTGPSAPTLHAIFNTLNSTFKGEKRGNLATYAGNIKQIPRDSRRDGQTAPSCDAACMQNLWMLSQSG